MANSFLCLPWRRSSTSVKFFWGPFVEVGIAGVVVVIVRLGPNLDVVVKDIVVESDEALVESDGADDEEDKVEDVTEDDSVVVVVDEVKFDDVDIEETEVEEITGMVSSEVDDMTGIVIAEVDEITGIVIIDVEDITGMVIIDVEDITGIVIPDVEDITGIVISEVDEMTGIVIAGDDRVFEIGKVVEMAEDKNPEEEDTKGVEVEEITGMVISEDDGVEEDKGADDSVDTLVGFDDDEVSGRDVRIVREELMIVVCLSVVFLVPDGRGDFVCVGPL